MGADTVPGGAEVRRGHTDRAESMACPFLPHKDSSVLSIRPSPPASASRRKIKSLKERDLCPGKL